MKLEHMGRGAAAMCEKCVEIDGKIARMQAVAARITDEMTLKGIAEGIAEYKTQKLALHPEQTEEK
jgi:hypothetical protein